MKHGFELIVVGGGSGIVRVQGDGCFADAGTVEVNRDHDSAPRIY